MMNYFDELEKAYILLKNTKQARNKALRNVSSQLSEFILSGHLSFEDVLPKLVNALLCPKFHSKRIIRTFFNIYFGNQIKDAEAKPTPFTRHIQKQFIGSKNWMKWNNYGKYDPNKHQVKPTWELDHKDPLTTIENWDIVGSPNFDFAWSLDNLQPLDAKENRDKCGAFTADGFRAILSFCSNNPNKEIVIVNAFKKYKGTNVFTFIESLHKILSPKRIALNYDMSLKRLRFNKTIEVI